jgi:carboxymethylenebutenolidase
MEQLEIILPPGGSGPGVMLKHPWWERYETVLNYGRRLAGRGFVVGLADAIDGNVVTDRDAAQGLLERYWQSAPALLAGNVHTLAAHDAVSGGVNGLGFSFGGFQLLQLQEELPLRRVVTYYADREVELKVPVLGHFAQTDPFADDQDGMIKKLEAAGPPSAAIVYPNTTHWFAEADRPEYDAAAAEAAFERSVAFLRAD